MQEARQRQKFHQRWQVGREAQRGLVEAEESDGGEIRDAVGVIHQQRGPHVQYRADDQRTDDRDSCSTTHILDLAREVTRPLEAGEDLESVDHRKNRTGPVERTSRQEARLVRRAGHLLDSGATLGVEVGNERIVSGHSQPNQPDDHAKPDHRETIDHVASDTLRSQHHQSGEENRK